MCAFLLLWESLAYLPCRYFNHFQNQVEAANLAGANLKGAILKGCVDQLTLYGALERYLHGGAFGRFFSLAWNRHHVFQVERFLQNIPGAATTTLEDEVNRLLRAVHTTQPHFNRKGSLAGIIKDAFAAKYNDDETGMKAAKKIIDRFFDDAGNAESMRLRPSVCQRPHYKEGSW